MQAQQQKPKTLPTVALDSALHIGSPDIAWHRLIKINNRTRTLIGDHKDGESVIPMQG